MYVQAETAPLHRGMQQLMQSVNQLETRASSSGVEARPEPHDPARRRVAFISFGAGTSADERIAAMDRFMKEHFADFRPIAINLFPDKTGKPSLNGFVEVCAPSQIRIILEAVKDRSLKLSVHAGVKIKGALTDIDRARNWALATAEEQIQSCPNAHGKVVKIEKGRGKGEKAVIRGVYVNDALAYSQSERFSKTGFVVGKYEHLKLP